MSIKHKNILVTGGCGFIGSNLAISLKNKYPNVKIICLDNLIRKGSEFNVERLKDNNIEFIKGDVRNKEDLEKFLFLDLIIECSAEPSVLAGYEGDPTYVIDTNLIGAINCFELARKTKAGVIFFSTSRVYSYEAINSLRITEGDTRLWWQDDQGVKVPGWSLEGLKVNFTLEGVRSMYGATKLSAEFILQEYMNMYGIKGIINRCGVIAGPWQFGKVDQGVFSLWMLAHYFKKSLKYIGFAGKGKQVRDLLHIDDLCELVDLQINKIDEISPKTYNVGGGREISLSLLEATELCQQITGNKIDISPEEETRHADIAIYISDNQKVYDDLGWKPGRSAKTILEDTFKWIKNNEEKVSGLI